MPNSNNWMNKSARSNIAYTTTDLVSRQLLSILSPAELSRLGNRALFNEEARLELLLTAYNNHLESEEFAALRDSLEYCRSKVETRLQEIRWYIRTGRQV
jgi:transcriptional antiterminator